MKRSDLAFICGMAAPSRSKFGLVEIGRKERSGVGAGDGCDDGDGVADGVLLGGEKSGMGVRRVEGVPNAVGSFGVAAPVVFDVPRSVGVLDGHDVAGVEAVGGVVAADVDMGNGVKGSVAVPAGSVPKAGVEACGRRGHGLLLAGVI